MFTSTWTNALRHWNVRPSVLTGAQCVLVGDFWATVVVRLKSKPGPGLGLLIRFLRLIITMIFIVDFRWCAFCVRLTYNNHQNGNGRHKNVLDCNINGNTQRYNGIRSFLHLLRRYSASNQRWILMPNDKWNETELKTQIRSMRLQWPLVFFLKNNRKHVPKSQPHFEFPTGIKCKLQSNRWRFCCLRCDPYQARLIQNGTQFVHQLVWFSSVRSQNEVAINATIDIKRK